MAVATFQGFPFISLAGPAVPGLHRNASLGDHGHCSFAVQAGGLFEGRASRTPVSAADTLSHGPMCHLSAHLQPCQADMVPVAALSSSSDLPKVLGRCWWRGPEQVHECRNIAGLRDAYLSTGACVPLPRPHTGGCSSTALSTESLHKQAGWRYRGSPCQQIPRNYHSYFLLCRRRSPASTAALQAAHRL